MKKKKRKKKNIDLVLSQTNGFQPIKRPPSLLLCLFCSGPIKPKKSSTYLQRRFIPQYAPLPGAGLPMARPPRRPVQRSSRNIHQVRVCASMLVAQEKTHTTNDVSCVSSNKPYLYKDDAVEKALVGPGDIYSPNPWRHNTGRRRQNRMAALFYP